MFLTHFELKNKLKKELLEIKEKVANTKKARKIMGTKIRQMAFSAILYCSVFNDKTITM